MLGNFKIIDVNERMSNGTSLVGYITEDYSTLVEVFGPPHYDQPSGDGKVHTEWNLEFTVQEDGEEDTDTVIATIYDWKEESAQVSRTTPKYQWHVGGHNKFDALECITQRITDHFRKFGKK
jgi:hypothetical protein